MTGTRSTTSEAMTRVVGRDFYDWAMALPVAFGRSRPTFPAPTDLNGLPDGYAVVARMRDYQKDTDLFLVSRNIGGCLIVRHEYDLKRSIESWISETLAELYAAVVDSIYTSALRPNPSSQVIAEWLKTVLVGMYDANDPVEASEQLLFALSGSLGTPPRAAC